MNRNGYPDNTFDRHRAFRVFISSTYEDLKPYRNAVREAVDDLHIQSVGMESFGARPDTPLNESLGMADSADALVVIVGWRYGWVPTAEKGGNGAKSITWFEVEAAEKKGIPVFAYIADDSLKRFLPKEQDRMEEAKPHEIQDIYKAIQELKNFKKHLNDKHTLTTFLNPDNLAKKVVTALSNHLRERIDVLRPGDRTPPVPGPDIELHHVSERKALREYLESVVSQFSRIKIQGIGSRAGEGYAASHFSIKKLFTPLKTAGPECAVRRGRSRSAGGDDELQHAGMERERDVKLSDLLKDCSKLMLVGAPGGGKTTFLRFIACVTAEDMLTEMKNETAKERHIHLGLDLAKVAPLPVFVTLAALSQHISRNDQGRDVNPVRCLFEYLESIHGKPMRNIIENRLIKGRAALLFDGLDEVPELERREQVINIVEASVKKWKKSLIVITSRPFGYEGVSELETMNTTHISDFGEDEIIEFIDRWAAAVFPEDQRECRKLRFELNEAIISSPTIRRLAKNPVMLTCLCVVHWNERKLPEGKADLLAAVLKWLLNSHKHVRESRGYGNEFAEQCFKTLAFEMTTHKAGKKAVADLSEAAEFLKGPFYNEFGITDHRELNDKGTRFLECEMMDSGIVERVNEGQVRFKHLTFQEHYAAVMLAQCRDEDDEKGWWRIISPHVHDRNWAEVLDHFAGCLAKTRRDGLTKLVKRILEQGEQEGLAGTARAVGVLGRLLRVLEVYRYTPPPQIGWTVARDRVMEIFTVEGAEKVKIKDRITAAEGLGQGGDPRLTPEKRVNNFELVPGREHLMLGIYPVTVEEFKDFVDDGGYSKEEFWGEYWKIREDNDWTKPDSWEDQLETPNRPVVEVSWYEAVAYCRWRSKLERKRNYRLPYEEEWEDAARNSNGPYPWGKDEPDAELANFYSNVDSPTPVGIYPKGAAPAGHLDMAGNVWEWCEDDVTEEYGGSSNRPLRALRGGGYWDVAGNLRSPHRLWSEAGPRDDLVGFRLVVAASTVDV